MDSYQKLAHWDHSWRIKNVKNEIRWVNARGNPKRDDDGSVYWILIVLDITKLKETEIELLDTIAIKDTLFRELHHRIKNNLNIISSLLFLKSQVTESSELKDFIRETKNRISSIAQTHDQLLKLEEVDQLYTTAYLEELIESIAKAYSVNQDLYRLDIDIVNLKFSVDKIFILGLLVHEMLSNTLKYAFEPNQGGEIYFFLQKHEDHLVFRYGDNGRGLPPGTDQSKSVGLNLIGLLSKQIDGELEIISTNGLEYKITLPFD